MRVKQNFKLITYCFSWSATGAYLEVIFYLLLLFVDSLAFFFLTTRPEVLSAAVCSSSFSLVPSSALEHTIVLV